MPGIHDRLYILPPLSDAAMSEPDFFYLEYPMGKYHPVNTYIAISFPALKSVPDLCIEYRTSS